MKELIMHPEDIYRGNLILVNARHPYRAEKGVLAPVCPGEEILLEYRAARSLNLLLEELDGWDKIKAVSGWRPLEEQEALYEGSLRENGLEYTRKYVALPGCSEHQTGLAIDLGRKQSVIDFICPDFPYVGICQEFRERAALFGFIERYPKGREEVTGIGREPWHFRYVGRPHAEIMKERGLVLEEYIEFLRDYPYGERPLEIETGYGRANLSFLKAEENAETCLWAENGVSCMVSGNNIDGFIVTEWRRWDEDSKTDGRA